MTDPHDMRRQVVAVFGASGHTGRFVIAELLRRGYAPVAIGRHGGKLTGAGFQGRGVPAITAAIEDAASLDRALAGAAAVVNCAGPFLDTANAVASAALRARIHYFDVTAEQASAQATYDRFDAAACDAGVVIMPAMGFFGGFGDLLATAAMGDWESADDVRIAIALDSWRPTPGTRLTGQRNTFRRLVIGHGKLTPQTLPAIESTWDFPEPFGRQGVTEVPLSEVIVIARHLRVSQLHSFLGNLALRDVADPATPPPEAADESGRSSQSFIVEVIVEKAGRTRRGIAQGRDIYAFTAPLVGEAVSRVLDGPARSGGAFAPGELFGAKDFLMSLVPVHLTLEIESR